MTTSTQQITENSNFQTLINAIKNSSSQFVAEFKKELKYNKSFSSKKTALWNCLVLVIKESGNFDLMGSGSHPSDLYVWLSINLLNSTEKRTMTVCELIAKNM